MADPPPGTPGPPGPGWVQLRRSRQWVWVGRAPGGTCGTVPAASGTAVGWDGLAAAGQLPPPQE
jgi:hypothetical protein